MKFNKEAPAEEAGGADDAVLLSALMSETSRPELRMTGIYGDVNEDRCSEAVYGLMAHGGLAADMFSVYDVIRELRDKTPIHTKGLGKVMSAGVLLLASGTKGQRRIGKYCRVMIHGVMAGQHGYLADVENEFKETRAIQRMYVKALAEETNMSEAYVRKLMNKKTNVYLDAEEAVKLGIADIIF